MAPNLVRCTLSRWATIPSFALLALGTAYSGSLADRVQRTYREIGAIRGEFVQKTRIELLEKTVEEQGSILLAKPSRFVIHYRGGHERKYVSDGKTLWIWRAGDEEVETVERMSEVLSREALAFLGGLGEMDREFHVTEQGGALTLRPRNTSSPFKRILLKIDAESHLAREILLYPKNGNVSRYVFHGLHTETAVADQEFRRPRGGRR